QFAVALARQPNRARGLLGAARAAAQSGDRAAAEVAYANFAKVWSKADAQLAELKEAQSFLKAAPARASK
ncbi:MAG: hypothetical protein HY046_03255, partial [Acidobacteria bacterium]|nr:hypothetical protein [Acidobacteriota bacterium]